MVGNLHDDFARLAPEPGESHITGNPELFGLVNVINFGGSAQRATHVPTELGSVGSVAIWESTGAADALPFWNTNFQSDVYLYLVQGSVRVEFKEPELEVSYGHYIGRTGDLLRLPKSIAHRTFSGDGKRRISLELVQRDPSWATIGNSAIPVDETGCAGDFQFTIEGIL